MTQKRQNKNKTPEHCILHIKKFGKIDEAQIELFPLTFFIGDNNSGKSYIMSLIYGLQLVTFSGFYRQNSKFIILPRNKIDQESKIIARELFSDILSSMKINDIDLMKTKKNIIITRQIFDYISSLINNTIKKDKDLLINNIFNAAVPIEDISIEFPYSDDMKISVSITNDFLSNSQIKEEPERDYLIEFYFSGSKNPTNSFYFPENLAKTQG